MTRAINVRCWCICLQAAQHDKTAGKRLLVLDQQLNELKKEQEELNRQWEKEKEEMQRLQSIKNEVRSSAAAHDSSILTRLRMRVRCIRRLLPSCGGKLGVNRCGGLVLADRAGEPGGAVGGEGLRPEPRC